ncbi:MAG: glycosyltransferase family 4 protein [candidate division Zixibacteria bacterium]|nr:glycosyltransferase family 4 protein [candidate division Zixibacteria bacterium]
MKVALINSTYFPHVIGGAELSVQYLAESLVTDGHKIAVICAAEQEGRAEINGVTVYYIKLRNLYWPYGRRHSMPLRLAWNVLDINNRRMAREVEFCLKDARSELVHTNNLQALSVAVWDSAKRLGLPIVHTIRDLYLLCPRSAMFRNGLNCERPCFSCGLFSQFRRPFGHQVDHVIGISRFVLNRHRQFGWFPDSGQSIIHNSFKPIPIVRRQRGRRLVFGFLGRLDFRKGIEWLLDGFSDPRISSSADLLVAGEGEPQYVSTLKSRSKELPVDFAGRLRQEQFFAKIDVLVVPSIIDEALGRSILEGYAYGTPVIASSRGGIPEIVESGRTGYLVDPAQPEQLVQRMLQFIKEPELIDKLSRACSDKFVEFTPQHIAEQYCEIYEPLLGHTGPRTNDRVGSGLKGGGGHAD